MKKSLVFILALALSLPTFAYAEIYDCESLKGADGTLPGGTRYAVRLEGAVFLIVTSQEGKSSESLMFASGPELFEGKGFTVRVTGKDLSAEVSLSKETYDGKNYSAPCTRRTSAE